MQGGGRNIWRTNTIKDATVRSLFWFFKKYFKRPSQPCFGMVDCIVVKHTWMDGWNCGLPTLGEMYLLTYKLAACVKMQSGIFVIIASSHSCKLFMETIQCKQVSAHILFSLTALVLDHSDIQLLRDLLLSLQTLKRYQNCSHFSNSKQLSHLLKFYLKVQWINTISAHPFHTHPGPGDVS